MILCSDAAEQLEQSRLELATFQQLNITETAAIPRRLETLTQVSLLQILFVWFFKRRFGKGWKKVKHFFSVVDPQLFFFDLDPNFQKISYPDIGPIPDPA